MLFYQFSFLLHTHILHGTISIMNTVVWLNIAIYVLFIWSTFWKGLALWRAGQLKQRNWFVVMLILNTVGILEIVYLFRFAKRRMTFAEMKTWKKYFMTRVSEKNKK